VRRPFHALTCLGTLAHHAFEVGAGVGLVFQPWLGLPGAAALWGVQLPAWFAATQGSDRWDRPLAFAAGMSLGGATIHYLLWPWEPRFWLPVLREAEGIPARGLPSYNAILWAWMAAAVVALARETPRRALPWGAAGVAAALPLRTAVRHHFDWIREEARIHPTWWNRAFNEDRSGLRPSPPPTG
jgi:hypothetical protein